MLQNKASTEAAEHKTKDESNENDAELIDELKQDDKINKNDIKNDCDIHDVFNGYVYGAQLLDLRDWDDYEKSHIHSAIHVDINNPEKALIRSSKKIICYNSQNNKDNKDNNDKTDKFEKLNRYCKTAKNCKTFRVTSDKFDFCAFKKSYPFMCLSVEEDKKMESESERKKYPNYIIDGLYLGDMWNRKSLKELKELGISHIVDATQDKFDTNQFEILKISLNDIPSAPIEKYFDKTVVFVETALQNKHNRVFIHCQMGISRSTTLVLAYLMKGQNYTLYDGYKLCQQNRPRIRPNEGFFNRLVAYELKVHGKSTKPQIDKEKLRDFSNQECIIM